MSTKEQRSGVRWRNPSKVVPMESLTRLFQSCPWRMVNPSPDVGPTRWVNGGGFPHITLLTIGVWDSLWHAGKRIMGLCKTYYGVFKGRGEVGQRKESGWISERQTGKWEEGWFGLVTYGMVVSTVSTLVWLSCVPDHPRVPCLLIKSFS